MLTWYRQVNIGNQKQPLLVVFGGNPYSHKVCLIILGGRPTIYMVKSLRYRCPPYGGNFGNNRPPQLQDVRF